MLVRALTHPRPDDGEILLLGRTRRPGIEERRPAKAADRHSAPGARSSLLSSIPACRLPAHCIHVGCGYPEDCSGRLHRLAAVLLCRMPSALLPLVLLPGTLCDERVFAPLISALGAQFPSLSARVTMTPHHATMRSAAEHVLATAPERFALLGFSLGGILALEIAVIAPERVLGLALLNVNPAPAPPLTHAGRRAAVFEAQAIGHAEYVRRHLWPSYVASVLQRNTDLQDLIASMAQDLNNAAFRSQTEAALTAPRLPSPAVHPDHAGACASRRARRHLPRSRSATTCPGTSPRGFHHYLRCGSLCAPRTAGRSGRVCGRMVPHCCSAAR